MYKDIIFWYNIVDDLILKHNHISRNKIYNKLRHQKNIKNPKQMKETVEISKNAMKRTLSVI